MGEVDAGAGQRVAPLRITTISGTSCRLSGYAETLQLRADDGSPLPTRPVRTGTGVPGEVLVSGSAPAHVILEWRGIPAAEGESPDQPPPATLAITLPGTGRPLEVNWTGGPVYDGGRLSHDPVQQGPG